MARLALSPRSAILIAVVVLLVVGVVAVVTARASGAGSVSTVTGAPGVPSAAASSSATAPDVSGAQGTGTAAAAAGAGAGAGSPSPSPSPSSSPRDGGVVLVHVAGAVAEPGLVRLRTGARVQQALRAAGGAVGDADLARVNLAEPVADGQRLYVPHVGETEIPQVLEPTDGTGGGTTAGAGAGAAPGGAPTGPGADDDSSAIDLNRADQAALETLPGIGPALAQRIVAWRDEHGAFASVDDLLQVSGIGDARLADLRPRVRV